MVRMDFRDQHFRIPSIPAGTQRVLCHFGRRAPPFRLRELRQTELLGKTDCTDDRMGEVHVQSEWRTGSDYAFLFTIGHGNSVATCPGRASSTNASLLTPDSE